MYEMNGKCVNHCEGLFDDQLEEVCKCAIGCVEGFAKAPQRGRSRFRVWLVKHRVQISATYSLVTFNHNPYVKILPRPHCLDRLSGSLRR